jgi:PAS domain S-box-containing protein
VTIILGSWRGEVQESELREKFLTESLALARALSSEPAAAFPTATDAHARAAFTRLSCHLHRFARFADYRDIWTLVWRDGSYAVGPGSWAVNNDCEATDAPAPAHLPRAINQPLVVGSAEILRPAGRNKAPFVSALAPVHDAAGSPSGALLLGVDIAAPRWRAAVWSTALLPLALGGFLTLTFGFATWYVYRSGANRIDSARHLRYLEPLLAAVTGITLSIAASSITYQLEQNFQSDLLESAGARLSLDLASSLTQANRRAADSAPAAGLLTTPQDLLTLVERLLPATLDRENRFRASIATRLLALNNRGTARLVGQLPAPAASAGNGAGNGAGSHAGSRSGTAPGDASDAASPSPQTTLVAPLAATAQPWLLLPIFRGENSFALQLRMQSHDPLGAPLRAAMTTIMIGFILTTVATLLVIWLRGRLALLEQLVDRRTATLQQREANFTAITNSVRDAIVMMDARSRIVYWNPAAEQLFGYTEEEVTGQDLHRLLAGPAVAKVYRSRGASSRSFGDSPSIGRLLELEARHKDGSPVPLELSLSAMRLDGQWHAIGVLRDIAARKRSQERLVKLNDCLAHLGADYRENIHRITTVCGEILEADTALYNRLDNGLLVTFGRWHAPEDLPISDAPEGHICYDLIRSGADRDANGACVNLLATVDKGQDAYYLEDLSQTKYLQSDPTVRKYALKAYFGHVVRCAGETVGSLCVVFKQQRSPTDEEKRLLGILAAALTTEENRHLATRELELSEKRMSLAMRSTGIGIWEYEPDTRELRADASMHELLGLHPVRAHRSIDDWILRLLPEDMTRLKDALETDLRADGELNEELRLQLSEEELRYLRIIGSVHGQGSNQRHYVIGVCYDITRRKESEARLRLAKDMAEKASRMKTQFLSQVSHELRTPMNAVLGFAQLLDSDPDLNEDQRDSVHEILQSGRHLLKLIDEVLDLAQIESGETDIQIQQLMLAPALEESLTLVRQLARERTLELKFSCAPELAIAADPFRLRQILLNLLSNAIKYNNPGGSVWVTAQAMADDWVRIQVCDSGPGIAPDRIDELFEPFRRLPDAQLRGVEGSGVGLAVVKRLVELMEGNIGVDSTPGEGSCFWFDLPRQPAEQAVAPLIRPEPPTELFL